MDTVFQDYTDQGYFYSAFNFSTAEHGGTHLDAPVHFAQGRQSVEEIPLESLIGKAVQIDLSAKAMKDPDYQISVQDLETWESEQEFPIPAGSIVLLQTGYSR